MSDETPATAPGTPGAGTRLLLRLFVAGNEPNSCKARIILERLCDQHLKGRYEIQIVDVLKDYQAAIAHQVIAVPTLIVDSPTKRTVIVGSLSDEDSVILSFEGSDEAIHPNGSGL